MNKELLRNFKIIAADLISIKANFLKAASAYKTALHLHPNLWHITYTIRGRGNCVVEGQSYHLRAGCIHVVYPNELHFYKADKSNPYEIYCVHIESGSPVPRVFPRIIKAGLLDGHTLRLFPRLTSLSHERMKYPIVQLQLHALLGVLLAELMGVQHALAVQTTDNVITKKVPGQFGDILDRLRSQPFHYPGIDALALRLHMSRRSFTNYFRILTGMSVMDYFQHYCMTHAQLLMESKEIRLKEIATQCGYSNPQNFLRAYHNFQQQKRK